MNVPQYASTNTKFLPLREKTLSDELVMDFRHFSRSFYELDTSLLVFIIWLLLFHLFVKTIPTQVYSVYATLCKTKKHTMFWWQRKKFDTLPYPEGPYSTGCVEVMNSCSPDSLFIRLMYPTDVPVSELKDRKTYFVPWLPDEMYLQAFAKLLNLWLIVLKIILWLSGKRTHIPTLSEEPVSSKVKKLPIAIFSHGYGATRFLCSTVCNELASRGYIVAAIEHKDLSASITYYYNSENSRDRDERTYLAAKPFNACISEHYETRNKQLKQRSMECSRVLNFLSDINEGKATNVLKTKFDLQSLKGKIDLSNPILMGHSFGGATTMYTLAVDQRFKTGIILDGWMFPLKSESIKISQPMLFINTHTFHLQANIKLMKKFSDLPQNRLYTMRNTTHESNSDTPLIYGYWLNLFMKKISGRLALKIQNYLILQFLHEKVDLDVDEELVQSYLKLQSCHIINDFILYSKVPMKKFSVF